MNAPTHILGGAVFTGTMCAFSDVNIFSDWRYLAVCGVCSLLPDIDTTKSGIGKIFYPIAWVINRKLGHRTFTHSLMFFFLFWVVFWLLLWFGLVQDRNLLKIALFALLSHFVFDMLTVSGIPLLYPFFRNPCVIPGNPAYRFKSGDWKAELIVCGVCGLLCITMQPLFANGFWTSYNRAFATIQHVNRENQNTEFYVICEFSYIQNAQTHQGEAIVIESKETELTLFDKHKVFKLSSTDPQTKIIHTKPRISTIEKRFAEIQFFNISLDSIQSLLSGTLASGLIQSNYNVRYIDDAVTYFTNFIKFNNRYDFHLFAGEDSSRSTIKTNIAKLEASINQTRSKHFAELNKWKVYQSSITELEQSLKSDTLSLYERNRKQKELMKLKNRNYEEPVFIAPVAQVAELEAHRKAMSERFLLFSGHLTVFQFGYDMKENQQVAPNFDINKTELFAHN